MKKYAPINSLEVPRFAEVRTFMRLKNIKAVDDIDYAIVGIPFDTGTSYRSGARFGPSAIRDISVIIKPYNYKQDINITETLTGVDYGDVPVITGYIEDTFNTIEEYLKPLIDNSVIPICMGGDHSVTLAELRALAKKHGPLALVHFDSHTDTVDSYFGKKYGHGTPFKRAVEEGLIDVEHSIQLGMRATFYSKDDIEDSKKLGFELLTSFEMHDMHIDEITSKIKERVGDKKAFCTFDIDFADPVYAPGTGTPEVGGFTSHEIMQMIRGLTDIDFVGYDVVEVLPMLDNSQVTALLAGNVMFEFISLLGLNKMKNYEKKED